MMKKQDEECGDHHTKSQIKQPRVFLLMLIVASLVLFVVFQIRSLYFQSLLSSWSSSSSSSSSWFPFLSSSCNNSTSEVEKLSKSVTFLPLKDLRYAESAMAGHTWFMSSLNDTHEEGDVQHMHFPSESSMGRLLCLKGRDEHDGAWNSYALAWPEALPEKATLKEGLTFVSYTHYPYGNIWHALSATVPLARWHLENQCRSPARWVLYFKGEVKTQIPPWLSTLLEAVYGPQPVNIEGFEASPVCFEEAVVTRHNEGGISRERLKATYDLLRCKARAHCNATTDESGVLVRVTMLMRSGARSFKNDTHVIAIFQDECLKIQGCRLQVAYSNNLTVCQQVKVMRETDVLISPHGAQLTNLFLMDKGSSVMEFFPKGWLKVAGVGQYVLHWLSDWSGMNHRGAWRDPDGPQCAFPEDDQRCMTVYKNAQIGHNETHFKEWASTVFNEVKARKLEEASKPKESDHTSCGCA